MRIEKVGRKWVVKGKGSGWIFNKTFPTKWKAEVALEVFKDGGRVSDYWRRQREVEFERPIRKPWRVYEKVEKSFDKIIELNPTCDEIEKYAKEADYGAVTYANGEEKFGPKIHNTWGIKRGGRVHIDIGCRGYHLMLDKHNAEDFIQFIERKSYFKKHKVTINL